MGDQAERPSAISADELAFLAPANKRAQEAGAVVQAYLGHLAEKYGPFGAVAIDAYTGAIGYPPPAEQPAGDEPAGEVAASEEAAVVEGGEPKAEG